MAPEAEIRLLMQASPAPVAKGLRTASKGHVVFGQRRNLTSFRRRRRRGREGRGEGGGGGGGKGGRGHLTNAHAKLA